MTFAISKCKIAKQRSPLDESCNTSRLALQIDLGRAELPEVEQALEALRKQLKEKREDRTAAAARRAVRRHRVAAAGGAPPAGPRHGDLPKWTGSPLDQKNLGAYLSAADACIARSAIRTIGKRTWRSIRTTSSSSARTSTWPSSSTKFPTARFTPKIAEIGPEMKVTPRQLSSKSGGELMSKIGRDRHGTPDQHLVSGPRRDRRSRRQADARPARHGQGICRLATARQALWRYLIRTFNFKL